MSETALSRSEMERIAREVLEETLSEQRFDLLEEQFAEEVAVFGEEMTFSHDRMRKEAEQLSEGLPDVTYTVKQVWVDGDTAIANFRMEGTFENEFTMPLEDGPVTFEPNGEETSFQGVYLFRFEGDRIVEMNGFADELEWFQQLDIVPEFDELGEPAESAEPAE